MSESRQTRSRDRAGGIWAVIARGWRNVSHAVATAAWIVGRPFVWAGRKIWAGWRAEYREHRSIAIAAAAVVVVFVVLGAVLGVGQLTNTSSSRRTAAPYGKPVVATFPSYTATALQPQIDVHSSPGGPTVLTLKNPLPEGTPLTLLMTPTTQQPGGSWIQVYLPIRPNGSTGYVPSSEMKLQGDPYQLVLSLSQRHLTLYKNGQQQDTFLTAVGAPDTPTPTGTFFLSELLKPTNPGVYGDFAYGLSGHSPTLTSFDGYDAELGLHGTGDPSTIGKAISHGCIRIYNPDISKLAAVLPLGTPMTIQS